MRAPIVLPALLSAALLYIAAAALPHAARALPQSGADKQPLTLQDILEQQPAGRPPSGQGRALGTIREQSPLMPPPSRQQFAPLLQPSAPQQRSSGKPSVLGGAPRADEPLRFSAANYPLTPELLTKLEKIHTAILNLPDLDSGEDDADDDIRGGVDVLVKAMEKRPDIMAVLGRSLISAPEYITAMQALANALAAASGAGEQPVFGDSAKIAPDNLAFGKKYAARIRALLEE